MIRAMLKSMTYPALSLVILTGCAFQPSRSYDQLPVNTESLSSESLNIDIIKPVIKTVASNKTWQNSGIFLENGDTVTVTASGAWSPAPLLLAWSGPEGSILWNVEVKGITGGALMAKLGHSGHPFEIGLTKTFRANDYGMLYFAMNEPFRWVFDNQGEVKAEVFIKGNEQQGNKKPNGLANIKIISFQYDDKTRKGSLSANIGNKPFQVRQYLINKIGEIASSKNVAIKAGQKPLKNGTYQLLDEVSNNGVLTLNFETLY